MEEKMRRSAIEAAAVIAVIVIMIAAMLLSLQGLVPIKNGDYVLFDVSVDDNSTHYVGSANTMIENVTPNGYDKIMRFTVNGISIPVITEHIGSLTDLTTMNDLGTLSHAYVKLNTVFGEKMVYVYQRNSASQQVTSWAGNDPLVQYKMVIVQGSLTTTLTMQSTNIDQVRTGNNYLDSFRSA